MRRAYNDEHARVAERLLNGGAEIAARQFLAVEEDRIEAVGRVFLVRQPEGPERSRNAIAFERPVQLAREDAVAVRIGNECRVAEKFDHG
jgi:hypothetical protein